MPSDSRLSALGPRLSILFVLVLSGGLVGPFDLVAQEKSKRELTGLAEAPEAPSIESVQARIAQLESATDLPEATRQRLVDLCKDTIERIRSAGSWRGKAETFEAVIRSVPEALAAIDAELGQPAPPAPPVGPEAGLKELEKLLSSAEQDLAAARKQSEDLEREPNRRANRKQEIPKLIAAAKEQLELVEKTPIPPDPAQGAAVWRMLLAARRSALAEEVRAHEKELKSYEAQEELLTKQRDLAALRLSRARKIEEEVRGLVNERRRREAESQAEEARQAARAAHPAVLEQADKNRLLAERRTGLVARIEGASRSQAELDRLLGGLRQEFQRVQERVEAAGLTHTIGLLLRKQRAQLPLRRFHEGQLAARQSEIGKVQLDIIDLEEERAALREIDARTDEILALLDSDDPEIQGEYRIYVETEVRNLLHQQAELLRVLIDDHKTYFDELIDLDTTERQLVAAIDEHLAYIDERVLWIRSAEFLAASEWQDFVKAWRWLLDPRSWLGTARALWWSVRREPGFLVVGTLLLGSLVILRRPMRLHLAVLGQQVSRASAHTLGPTLIALVLTVLVALPLPAALWFLGWLLLLPVEASEFTKAVGTTLQVVFLPLFTLEALRGACRADGLGSAHFGWPSSARRSVRKGLTYLLVLGLPLAVIVSMTESQGVESYKSSLGRVGFLCCMGLLAGFVRRVLGLGGPVVRFLQASDPEGWPARLRMVWYPLTLGAPLALAAIALVGYHYTAMHLAGRLLETLWLFLALLCSNAILLRWLLLARRRMAMEQTRQRRAALQGEGPAAEAGAAPAEIPPPPEVPALDLRAIHAQTRQLLRTFVGLAFALGLWAIWNDVLPALAVFERIPVWEVETSGLMGGPPTITAITLGHLLLAIATGMVTVLAIKNVPGFLEITLLQRLPIDAGARYAISTLSRYLITLVGIVGAFELLGIGWTKVQWLVAAMTVGLGFGLQEIFANFVSGLILLFERPVRVGDLVTVGDVSGVVSRIRIRATTITDWDRKELIVPNKEFVTGRVLNWTLTDSVNRVVINVGIAYGSNVDQATAILSRIAQEHPMVMKDPAPLVSFEGFGESALNLVLRCFLPSFENRLAVVHDLHRAIDRQFRDAGIEIPFPQRDVHFRPLPTAPPAPPER